MAKVKEWFEDQAVEEALNALKKSDAYVAALLKAVKIGVCCVVERDDVKQEDVKAKEHRQVVLKKVSRETAVFLKQPLDFVLVVDKTWWDGAPLKEQKGTLANCLYCLSINRSQSGAVKSSKVPHDIQVHSPVVENYGFFSKPLESLMDSNWRARTFALVRSSHNIEEPAEDLVEEPAEAPVEKPASPRASSKPSREKTKAAAPVKGEKVSFREPETPAKHAPARRKRGLFDAPENEAGEKPHITCGSAVPDPVSTAQTEVATEVSAEMDPPPAKRRVAEKLEQAEPVAVSDAPLDEAPGSAPEPVLTEAPEQVPDVNDPEAAPENETEGAPAAVAGDQTGGAVESEPDDDDDDDDGDDLVRLRPARRIPDEPVEKNLDAPPAIAPEPLD